MLETTELIQPRHDASNNEHVNLHLSELADETSKDSPSQKNLIEIITRNGMHITLDENDVD